MRYSEFLERLTAAEGVERDWKRIHQAASDNLTHHDICENLCKHITFDSMIDAGPGSIGSEAWSINILKPECTIYGFEPGETRYQLLKDSSYPGILHQMALSNKEGELEGGMGFEEGRSDFLTNANKLCYKLGLYKKTYVKSTTIDNVIQANELNNVLIWADIEGAEYSLLEGAKKSFEQKKIAGFWTELNFSRDPTQTNFCSYKDVIKILDKYGFRSVTPIRVHTSDQVYQVPWYGTHADCLFLPQDHALFDNSTGDKANE